MEKAGMATCFVVLLLLLLLKVAGKCLENRWNVVDGFTAIASTIGFFVAFFVTIVRAGNATWTEERSAIFFWIGCVFEGLLIIAAVSAPLLILGLTVS